MKPKSKIYTAWIVGILGLCALLVAIYYFWPEPNVNNKNPSQSTASEESCLPIDKSEMIALLAPPPDWDKDGDWYRFKDSEKFIKTDSRPEWWSIYRAALYESLLTLHQHAQENQQTAAICEWALGGPLPSPEDFAAKYVPRFDCHIRELSVDIEDWLREQQFMHEFDPALANYFPSRRVALTRLGLLSVEEWTSLLTKGSGWYLVDLPRLGMPGSTHDFVDPAIRTLLLLELGAEAMKNGQSGNFKVGEFVIFALEGLWRGGTTGLFAAENSRELVGLWKKAEREWMTSRYLASR